MYVLNFKGQLAILIRTIKILEFLNIQRNESLWKISLDRTYNWHLKFLSTDLCVIWVVICKVINNDILFQSYRPLFNGFGLGVLVFWNFHRVLLLKSWSSTIPAFSVKDCVAKRKFLSLRQLSTITSKTWVTLNFWSSFFESFWRVTLPPKVSEEQVKYLPLSCWTLTISFFFYFKTAHLEYGLLELSFSYWPSLLILNVPFIPETISVSYLSFGCLGW